MRAYGAIQSESWWSLMKGRDKSKVVAQGKRAKKRARQAAKKACRDWA